MDEKKKQIHLNWDKITLNPFINIIFKLLLQFCVWRHLNQSDWMKYSFFQMILKDWKFDSFFFKGELYWKQYRRVTTTPLYPHHVSLSDIKVEVISPLNIGRNTSLLVATRSCLVYYSFYFFSCFPFGYLFQKHSTDLNLTLRDYASKTLKVK